MYSGGDVGEREPAEGVEPVILPFGGDRDDFQPILFHEGTIATGVPDAVDIQIVQLSVAVQRQIDLPDREPSSGGFRLTFPPRVRPFH